MEKRGREGEFSTLYRELTDDGTKFFLYFKMPEDCFSIMLSKIPYPFSKRVYKCLVKVPSYPLGKSCKKEREFSSLFEVKKVIYQYLVNIIYLCLKCIVVSI